MGLISTQKSLAAFPSLGSISKVTIYDKGCVECNISTTWHCQTCDAPYCTQCFEKTHNGGKLMRKHIFTDSEIQNTVNFSCQDHEHLLFVNFCNTCCVAMCVACTNIHDEKHTIKSIKAMVSYIMTF